MPWSDWQGPWAMPFSIGAANWPFYTYEIDDFAVAGNPTSVQDFANIDRNDIRVFGSANGHAFDRWFETIGDSGFQPGDNYQMKVLAGYVGANLDGSGWADFLTNDLPDAMSGLTLGVDYDSIPGWDGSDDLEPNEYVQYEDGSTSFAGWDDLGLPLEMVIDWFALGDSAFAQPSTFPLSFWATAPDVAQAGESDSGKPFLDYEDGTVLNHYDLDITPPYVSGGGSVYTATPTISLSSWPDPTLALVVMPRALDPTSDVPGPDPGIAFDGVNGWQWLWRVQPSVQAIPTATVRYTSSRWRYWIPEADWHTVGGHFATVGGVGLKILTPGRGWVPVVDGPA